jgi:hypothetical protein
MLIQLVDSPQRVVRARSITFRAGCERGRKDFLCGTPLLPPGWECQEGNYPWKTFGARQLWQVNAVG